MHYANFRKSWMEALTENTVKNVIILGLVVALVIAVHGAVNAERVTHLVPPNLTEEVTVARDKASAGYKKSFALYVATLLGNITPSNTDLIIETVGGFFDPEVYRRMADTVADNVSDIREDSLTVSFEPQQTVYEPDTDKVFVFGRFSAVGVTGEPKTFMRTYEMRFAIRQGRLWVTEFAPYEGSPRTIEFLKTQAATVAQAK